jgi:hypothetical protein
MPDQYSNCASGSPASAIVGISGSAPLRRGPVTASGRSFPSRSTGSSAGTVNMQ